jgi:hypothetical protein
VDDGGFGVPPKIGKVNMNGSNPVVLVEGSIRPLAITIDIEKKTLYFSEEYPSFVSKNKTIAVVVVGKPHELLSLIDSSGGNWKQ